MGFLTILSRISLLQKYLLFWHFQIPNAVNSHGTNIIILLQVNSMHKYLRYLAKAKFYTQIGTNLVEFNFALAKYTFKSIKKTIKFIIRPIN